MGDIVREYWTLHFDSFIQWRHVIVRRGGFVETTIKLTPEVEAVLCIGKAKLR